MRPQLTSFVLLAALAFVLLAAFASSSVVSDVQAQVPTSVPFFLWSPQSNIFQGSKQFFQTVSHGIIRTILDKITHLETTETAAVELAQTNVPEVLVVFLENKLSTQQFNKMKSNADFKNLQTSVTSAKSSIIFPYAYVNVVVPVSSWLERFAAKLAERYPSVAVILSRYTESSMLEDMTQNARVTVNSHEDLLSTLNTDSNIFSNNIPDLVICALDSENFDSQDSFIGKVIDIVNAKTNGNAVYMFTGDVASTSTVYRAHTMEEIDSIHLFSKKSLLASPSNLTPYNVGMFSSYWPIQMFEVLMVSFMLLFTLFVGSYCLFSSQPAIKFEAPKKVRAAEIM
jgi:hypothetical protein